MRIFPSIGRLFSRVRRCRAGSSVHSPRGTQPEPLPLPAAAITPPKREREELEALLAYESEDRLQLTATGLVFRMKVVEVQEHFKHSIEDCECIINNMLDMKLHKRRNKLRVDLCLSPSTVHLTRVEPWELLHDHHMDSVMRCCSSARDGRALFYFVSMPSEDKILCFHLRSMKKSKAVTVQRICKVMTYAKSLLPGPPRLQEEPALTELKKASMASVIGTDGVLSAAGPSIPSISQDELPRVSPNVSREWQMRQAPAGGKGIEKDNISTIFSGSASSNANPQRKCSMDKDFEIPPVVLLKPGERFDVTSSVEVNHGSKRFILNPDELAVDEHSRVVSGVRYTESVVEDNVDVKVTGVSTAEREDGHKCSSLAVSCKKQRSPAAGDGFDLPVILLKPGEKFPNTGVVSFHPSPSCHEDKALQVSEEISAGNEFDLPPVILLKPGEKFEQQQSLDFIHCSKYYIFDPDELATDWCPRVALGEECTEHCAEMIDDNSSSDAPSTSSRLGQGVLNDAAESVGDGHSGSTFVVSGKKQLSCVTPTEGDFHLPPVILLKPGETFPNTSTSTISVRASMFMFDPDEIASDWQPREVYSEGLSINQAETLHLGISGGFSMASRIPPPIAEPLKPASFSTLPTDGSTTFFPT